MKIKGAVGETQQDAVKISRQSDLLKEQTAKVTAAKAEKSSSDSVNIALSKFISEQLDPTKMADERRKKIENLKSLIASGEYKPTSLAVAQALEEEVGFEIMTSDNSKLI